MAATVKRIPFSGSTNGRGIKVVATATAGTTIHTVASDTTDGNGDEIWIYAYNSHTAGVILTMEMGGATVPDDNIIRTIPATTGLICVVPGLFLRSTLVVKAFASVANVIALQGYVNHIAGN